MNEIIPTFESFLFEIGDSIIKPKVINNLETNFEDGEFKYSFILDNEEYRVDIKNTYELTDDEILVYFEVTFSINKDNKYVSTMSNKGNPLQVLGAVTHVVMIFINSLKAAAKSRKNKADSIFYQRTAYLSGIHFKAKSEDKDDDRRARLYAAFLKKNLQKLDISISDVTTLFNKDSISYYYRFEHKKLNEGYVGSTKTSDGNFFFYENVLNIKRLKPSIRGFIKEDGTFYVFDSDAKFFITHDEGLKAAYKMKLLDKSKSPKIWYESEPVEFVCVHRAGTTGEFYISDSYEHSVIDKYYDTFRKFVKAAQKNADSYNPELLFFAELK
jgi:hypothetical protein